MKQRNDPATHTPFINTESFINEANERTKESSMPMSLSQGILATQESEAILMSDLNFINIILVV